VWLAEKRLGNMWFAFQTCAKNTQEKHPQIPQPQNGLMGRS
jgi:hypothetical protein